MGHGKYFVVEADEYRDHFLQLKPQHAIITSIDFDHSDYFPSFAAVKKSFAQFIKKVSSEGFIVTTSEAHADRDVPWPPRTTAVGPGLPQLQLVLPGEHMQRNAWLAITLAEKMGVTRASAVAAIASFPGLGRRFETIGQVGKLQLISDYGHHPAEIEATLIAARQKYPTARIAVILEPHTATRLQSLFAEFVTVLAQAKVEAILICPTFYVRGREKAPVNASRELYAAISRQRHDVVYLPTLGDLSAQMTSLSSKYDIIIAFTAGELDRELRLLVNGPV